eukprot:CAMPEP_0197027048 /NCGR_PEP_ID=MMETSP1384-20130603/7038_1 /TAXON_ID=29189 /ORGANISM="Ammonia sp." /LENGTH=1006 /DNA_ID=CAMNT_0042455839 /DNA_START=98 /DNA_END=3118 /DNA_ORIENTATION=-
MPAVRGLEDYLRTLEVVESRPLHELQGTTIGVDVFLWLRSNNFINKEALHSALGGLPITLETQVHDQLHEFHKWGINPLFVFNGLKYSQNARAPFSSSRSRKYAAKRKSAWKAMENNNIQKAIELFSGISGYVSISAQDDLIRIFSRWNAMIPQRNKTLKSQYLKEQKQIQENVGDSTITLPQPQYFRAISWFRAPYYAASQMAYLESQEEMLHASYGGCDLLMFGAERVILNIDFKTATYEMTELEFVLNALKVDLNPYCFIDTCLLSGFDASRTFEPLTLTDLTSFVDNSSSMGGKKRSGSRRNWSYKHSLEQVLKRGSGLGVIQDHLCTFNDTGSTSSYNSNYSASTYTSQMSTRSLRSIGGRSQASNKSTRSAINLNTYLRKNKMNPRVGSGNIDKMLQHMLTAPDENEEHENMGEDMNNGPEMDEEDEKMENPKYRAYMELYLVVRKRVCNAKVLSFNGRTKWYQPFKFMNEHILKQKKEQLKAQQTEEELKAAQQREAEEKDKENKDGNATNHGDGKDEEEETKNLDDTIPNNVYRLLGVGVLSTFLPSAILGGHLIDTTPLIDSQELENAMNSLLPLRQRVLHVFQHGMGTQNTVSLQRWFEPNRQKQLKFDADWTSAWAKQFKHCLSVIFHEKTMDSLRINDTKRSIALVTPLKMLAEIRRNHANEALFTNYNTDGQDERADISQIRSVGALLTAAYCGTLITLNMIGDSCELSNVAMALSMINKFEFETVLAIEMLQKQDLSEKVFTGMDENNKPFQIDSLSTAKYKTHELDHKLMAKRRTLRLLTRVCSLLPMRPFIDGKREWEAKLSHSLAAFNHVTTAYHHAIKNCIESSICWIYCNMDESETDSELVSPTFLKELALSLKQLPPEPCSAMGVLIQEFVINFAELNWNNIANQTNDAYKNELIQKQLQLLRETFPVFSKTQFAIQNCMQFFYQICTLVKELGDAKVLLNAAVAQFEDAYEYLRELGIWDAIYFMEIQQNHNRHQSTTNSNDENR